MQCVPEPFLMKWCYRLNDRFQITKTDRRTYALSKTYALTHGLAFEEADLQPLIDLKVSRGKISVKFDNNVAWAYVGYPRTQRIHCFCCEHPFRTAWFVEAIVISNTH